MMASEGDDAEQPNHSHARAQAQRHSFKIVTPKYWWNGDGDVKGGNDHSTATNTTPSSTNAVKKLLPILDVRTESQYQENQIHQKRSHRGITRSDICIVPIPLQDLPERTFELPARHLSFAILAHDNSDLERVQEIIEPRTRRKRDTTTIRILWKVPYVMLGNDPATWDELKAIGIHASGNNDDDDGMQEEHTPFPLMNSLPFPRLWQPDPMVESLLTPLLRDQFHRYLQDVPDLQGNSRTSTFQIWDLASGAGRDVAFVAESLAASAKSKYANKVPLLSVVAVDHRYRKPADIHQVTSFFERRGVGPNTQCVCSDASTWDNVEKEMLSQKQHHQSDLNENAIPAHVAAVYCVRFWKPELVRAIAQAPPRGISIGTVFAISHFCKPAPGASWNFPHPSEKTVLERHELRDMFLQLGRWQILFDEIALDSDHGRTMIHFVARRV